MKLHPYIVDNQQFDALFITRGNFNMHYCICTNLYSYLQFSSLNNNRPLLLEHFYSTNVSFHIHRPRNICLVTMGTLSVARVKISQKQAL